MIFKKLPNTALRAVKQFAWLEGVPAKWRSLVPEVHRDGAQSDPPALIRVLRKRKLLAFLIQDGGAQREFRAMCASHNLHILAHVRQIWTIVVVEVMDWLVPLSP